MRSPRSWCLAVCVLLAVPSEGRAQEKHAYQSDFTAEEFAARRAKIYDAIGTQAIAVVQGASGVPGFSVFRQSNDFYYLCGVESAHAYLLLNGRSRTATLYLPHRDAGRERSEGKILSVEDSALVTRLTGVTQVKGLESLALDLISADLIRPPALALYTPLSPMETGNDSRDELLAAQARSASDPWDGRPSREAHFVRLVHERFPQFVVRDLAPTLDSLRVIKSAAEIALIRKATELAGLGIMEAMRSTAPGVYEYQLDAAAKYVFYAGGARGDGYASIIGGGTNAFLGHYFRKSDALRDGDLVLMDYAPDYRYYTSDVTRMWPVNGTYTAAQRMLVTFILEYRTAFFRHIKAGVTPEEVLMLARRDMEPVLAKTRFAKEIYRKAAEEMLSFRGHLQHPVGMTVHDPGTIWGQPFREGQVFTVDPMMWIPDEKLYVRMEDTILVTTDGIENFTAFLASTPDEIEAVMKQEGILSRVPRLP